MWYVVDHFVINVLSLIKFVNKKLVRPSPAVTY